MASNWMINLSTSLTNWTKDVSQNISTLFSGEDQALNTRNHTNNNNTNGNNNTNKDTLIRVTTTNNVVEETASPLPRAHHGGQQGERGAAHKLLLLSEGRPSAIGMSYKGSRREKRDRKRQTGYWIGRDRLCWR